ncbi:hypothetical protein CWR48_13905 [Oceanobacillus arenosus]|uniref:HNH domain-containing protein n=1 Tax=Oceanobacillus arenosus TaxID=1229153 RepID=A0A3D8PPY8_9BACI|nr:HNH endonuclease [Oceanobacillus arenosus]RDW17607.1 hypothetical protein CWR48_13905 [Oceanobacillus arenosus]
MAAIPKPNHKRRVPKRVNRGKFNKETREKVNDRDRGLCQQCGQVGTEVHHVMFKSRGGRGVFTNALTLCNGCHIQVHKDNELADYWIDVYTDRYGPNFYKDEWDLR